MFFFFFFFFKAYGQKPTTTQQKQIRINQSVNESRFVFRNRLWLLLLAVYALVLSLLPSLGAHNVAAIWFFFFVKCSWAKIIEYIRHRRWRWRTYVAAGNISVSIKLNYILMKLFVISSLCHDFFFRVCVSIHFSIESLAQFQLCVFSHRNWVVQLKAFQRRQQQQQKNSKIRSFHRWPKLIDVTVHSVPFCFQDI